MANHGASKAVVGGFATGLLAGGVIALLYAPASGRITRARVSHRLRETADSARELQERMDRRLREAARSARRLEERVRRSRLSRLWAAA
jgi:gas vesicle protein